MSTWSFVSVPCHKTTPIVKPYLKPPNLNETFATTCSEMTYSIPESFVKISPNVYEELSPHIHTDRRTN